MILDNIHLKKNQHLACFENIIAAVCDAYNKNYELMFSKMWEFDFKLAEETHSPQIGKRLTGDFKLAYDDLEHYHGMKVEYIESSQNDILQICLMQLEQGMPVAVLPFNQNFIPGVSEKERTLKTYHGALLVIGYDKSKDAFLCLDAHSEVNLEDGVARTVVISFSDFLQGMDIEGKFSCYTFHIEKMKENHVPQWKEVLKERAETLLRCNEEGYNKFDLMNHLAFELNNVDNIYLEFIEQDSIYKTPLIKGLKKICRGRYLFTITLSYLNGIYHSPVLSDLYLKFNYVAALWNTTLSIIAKGALSKDYNMILKATTRITEIAQMEQGIAQYILQMTSPSHIHRIDIESSDFINDYVYLDLNEFVNNKCCSVDEQNKNAAKFTAREYFILNHPHTDGELIINHMKYKLPKFNSSAYDNIGCSSQILYVPRSKYKKIGLLGNSEKGALCEKIEINYSDGTTESLFAGFSNWFGEPMFGEDKAITGKRVKDAEIVAEDTAYIFSSSYFISEDKEMVSIQLPDCHYIHIFAVTLAR